MAEVEQTCHATKRRKLSSRKRRRRRKNGEEEEYEKREKKERKTFGKNNKSIGVPINVNGHSWDKTKSLPFVSKYLLKL